MQYIPLARIKYALGQNADFIWNSVETFSHISRIEITDEEQERLLNDAMHQCNARGYVSITSLSYEDIEERNHDLSVTAIHNAIFRICLSDKFDKKGKIITRKGDVFDALGIMKEYCRTVDKCTLEDLLNFERELTGEVHRWMPLEAGNQILIRVDKNTYVADKYVYFDVETIDAAIESIIEGEEMLIASGINSTNKKGSKNEASGAICRAFERLVETPFGTRLNFGYVTEDGGYVRSKCSVSDPRVVLYGLFKFAEKCNDYKEFTLATLLNDSIERDGVSPTRIFGFDRADMPPLLLGLSAKYPDYIAASFTRDLEKITLKADKSSADVLNLFRGYEANGR